MTELFDPGHDSPFLRFLAPLLQEWRDGNVRTVLPLRGDVLNRSGVVHGGVLVTMLDHACGLTGLYCSVPGNRRYAVTLSINTSFMSQANGGILTVVGERKSSGRKIYFSGAEIRTSGGVLVAAGTGVFRYRGGSELPGGCPRVLSPVHELHGSSVCEAAAGLPAGRRGGNDRPCH